VNDKPALLSVLARVLRRAGASVDEVAADEIPVASGVVDALTASDPDVILLDLNLGSFSGLEVLTLLRGARPDLHDRVLLLTGGSPPEPEPERPVIHKLAEWPELFARIHEVAARPEGRIHP
jgi:DNA-binding response OmpR family regulator